MKTYYSVFCVLGVVLLVAAGCSRESNNKGKIEGTKWHNEKCTVEGKEIDEGGLYLEFKKDGKLVYGTLDGDIDGTYTLGAGDQVTFDLDKEVGGHKKLAGKITITGDKLTLADNKSTIPFSRIREDKLEETGWYNEPKESTGKYRDVPAGMIDFRFEKDGAVMSHGEKIGAFSQGPGDTLTITFAVKFRDTDWKSKAMPVIEHKEFMLTDTEGSSIKMKRR